MLEALPYGLAFWTFVFSSDFRSKVFQVWRARSGLGHLRTALEAIGVTIVGLVPLAGPFALVWILFS